MELKEKLERLEKDYSICSQRVNEILSSIDKFKGLYQPSFGKIL